MVKLSDETKALIAANKASMVKEQELLRKAKEDEDNMGLGKRALRAVGGAAESFKDSVGEQLNFLSGGTADDLLSNMGFNLSDENKALSNATGSSASFGLLPAYDRMVGAAGQVLFDRDVAGNEKKSFSDFVDERTAERQRLSAENPGHTIAGEMAGSMALGPLSAAKTGVGRVAKSAALGAGQLVGQEAGEGQDEFLEAGLLGMLGGGVGGALGEGIGKLGVAGGRVLEELGFNPNRHTLRQAASSLMDDGLGTESVAAAANRGRGFSHDELQTLADRMPADGTKMMAEGNPDLLRVTGDYSANPDVTGMTAGPAEISAQRVAATPDEMKTLIEENLTDSTRAATGRAAQDANAEMQDAAKQQYKQIFDSWQGSVDPVITKSDLEKMMPPMTANDTPSIKAARKRVSNIIRGTGDKSGNLSMKALQNIKMEFDKNILNAWSENAASVDKLSTAEMVDAKKILNEFIQTQHPDYAKAASMWGQTISKEEAREVGRNMIRGTNTSAPLSTVDNYVKGFSQQEQGHMQDGAMEWLLGQIDQNPNFVKKLAKSNPDMVRRITTIFGGALDSNATNMDDLAGSLDKVLTDALSHSKVVKGHNASGRNAAIKDKDVGPIKRATDIAIIGVKALTRQFSSGSAWSAVRRLPASNAAAANQGVYKLLTETDPNAVRATLMDMQQLRSPEQAGTTGKILGALGRGTAAGINSILGY